MSKQHAISLRTVMHLPTNDRLMFILANYPQMNIDLVNSLLSGFARLK